MPPAKAEQSGLSRRRVSPRVFRVVALPAPSDREKTQMFFQRYLEHFPAAGEIVHLRPQLVQPRRRRIRHGLLHRGRSTSVFLQLCPEIEKYIVDAGIILIKLWLEAGMEEQEKRFAARIDDPLRQWKLSPMDLESYRRWYDYSRARDMMLKATDSKHAPWYVVRSEDKKRARLNCISHLLKTIPYSACRRSRSNCRTGPTRTGTMTWRPCGE